MISAEQYLHTSYQDGDREYLDGAVLERNLGSCPHSAILGALSVALGRHEKRLGLEVLPSCRLRISDTRYRVPDVTVMLKPFGTFKGALASVPFLVIEILEEEDLVGATLQRCRDYAGLGVPHVILLDPEDGETLVFEAASLLRRDLTGFDVPERGFLPFDSRELLAQLDDE